jgi:hypothetical protein
MTVNPRPGDLGFVTIAGLVGGGINIGQALLHDACRFSHVFVVVYPVGDDIYPDGLIVEAMPEGARFQPLADRLGPGWAYADTGLTDDQRAMVPAIARSFVEARGGKGVPYSFATYLALALAQYGLTRALAPGLEKIIDNRGHLICSQLSDELLTRCGMTVFTGRWRGDVTPGDLYYRFDPRVIQPEPPAISGLT